MSEQADIDAAGGAVRAAPEGAPGVPAPAGSGGPGEPLPASDVAALPGILQLAWPAILGNLLHSAVGFIDIKIVGSLGAGAVAAVTTGVRMFFVLQAILMAVTAGTTALVARAWGAGDHEEAARITRTSLWICGLLGASLGVLGFVFADPFARVFKLDAETIGLAATYIRWMSLFHVAFAVQLVLGVALRAAGDTRTPLWIGALTNVVNVFLAVGLVYGKFGFPAMGVAGAAIAAGASFAVGAVVFVWMWLRGSLLIRVGSRAAFGWSRVRRLTRIGYPAAIEQFIWQGGFLVFLWIVALYGTAPYAAYGIGVNILSFSFVVGFGFSIAASTLVGQHLGAGDPGGATRSGWRAMWLSIGAMILLGLAIIVAAYPLARFMIDDPEVVRLTVVFIYILGAVQPLMAVEFTLSGALRGAGDTRWPLISVMSGFIGVRLVLAGVFAWLDWSVEWVYAALIGDYIVKATILTTRFARGRWQATRV